MQEVRVENDTCTRIMMSKAQKLYKLHLIFVVLEWAYRRYKNKEQYERTNDNCIMFVLPTSKGALLFPPYLEKASCGGVADLHVVVLV